MCGIAAVAGRDNPRPVLEAMAECQRHRGPDATGIEIDSAAGVGLAHNRLSIIDLSSAGNQPMSSASGHLQIIFNGEIYNYPELRAELSDYPYRSRTDTEVLLAAYERWGAGCLDRLQGMFAFLIWDRRRRVLFGARDRFGVKPLYYSLDPNGGLVAASEIKALHAAGIPRVPDATAWSTYLAYGLHDHSPRTFWNDIVSLPPGHWFTWADGRFDLRCWYDVAERAGSAIDCRPLEQVEPEYEALLEECVRFRFRSDVPVGINLSGGLDSSILLGLVRRIYGADAKVKAYTYITNDPRYDELPWTLQMLAATNYPTAIEALAPGDVPFDASSIQRYEDEPFGGFPTLAYARLFQRARQDGCLVLLDGQGMDEQWGGYDYYVPAANGHAAGLVQGTRQKTCRPECLTPEFAKLAEPFDPPKPFPDLLRNLQYRDIRYTKIPRALRFNDRVSMRSSVELREPFLDHRLVELAIRQRPEWKIGGSVRKWMLRRIASRLMPATVSEAPKRPLQTPQREWLCGECSGWAAERIESALQALGGTWLETRSVRDIWRDYRAGNNDNSFYIWQWISLGLMLDLDCRRN